MGCSNKVNGVVQGETMDSLKVWSLGTIKDFVVFQDLLEALGATRGDLEMWIADEDTKTKKENEEIHKLTREMSAFMSARSACPQCGEMLDPFPVNTQPCNRIGGKYKYLLQCVAWSTCGWERAITVTLHEYMNERKRRRIAKFKQNFSGHKEK